MDIADAQVNIVDNSPVDEVIPTMSRGCQGIIINGTSNYGKPSGS